MLNTLAFANALAIIVIVFHPIIYLALKTLPNIYTWIIQLAAFGIKPQLTEFDFSFKNMIIGTILKAILFWVFGLLLAGIYNFLIR